ncbi:MAG TPA: nucleoside-diphosphate kinase [Nitrospirae bacterium]|nr:nucleoside-diphosphate kinase [Nitrospirota bacterium]
MIDRKEIEQTLVLIKPDALKNSLTGYVLSQLSEFHTGLRFAATKIVNVSKMLADEHYAEHRGKIFFPSLIEYIMGLLHYPDQPWKHRVIAIIYQGPDAVKKMRNIAGPTNPHIARDEKPGCIRALGTVVPLKDAQGKVIGERMDNIIHASATDDEAEHEVKLWFKPNDIPPLMRAYPAEVNDTFYYFKDGSLSLDHEPGSMCFLAPGNTVWKSDLEALRLLSQGQTAQSSLKTVVAKYLINEE